MTSVLTTFTMLLHMLAHSMFGCCWHHQHRLTHNACCQNRATASVVDRVNDGGQCKSHSHHHDGRLRHGVPSVCTTPCVPDEPQPDSPSQCEEDRCVFIDGRVVERSEPIRTMAWMDASAEQLSNVGTDFQSQSSVGNLSTYSPCVFTSLERCARLQSWLI